MDYVVTTCQRTKGALRPRKGWPAGAKDRLLELSIVTAPSYGPRELLELPAPAAPGKDKGHEGLYKSCSYLVSRASCSISNTHLYSTLKW